jgi:hypothetical protein
MADLLAEGVARPAEATPALEQLRVIGADGTAGASVAARILDVPDGVGTDGSA